jgi:hypothetical protein
MRVIHVASEVDTIGLLASAVPRDSDLPHHQNKSMKSRQKAAEIFSVSIMPLRSTLNILRKSYVEKFAFFFLLFFLPQGLGSLACSVVNVYLPLHRVLYHPVRAFPTEW